MNSSARLHGPRWQMRWVELERKAIEAKINAFPADAISARLSIVDYHFNVPSSETGSSPELKRYVAAAIGARIAVSFPDENPKRVQTYIANARSILQIEQISDENETLGWLVLELDVVEVLCLMRQARWSDALWLSSKLLANTRLEVAHPLGEELRLAHGLCCLRLGQVNRALEIAQQSQHKDFENLEANCRRLLNADFSADDYTMEWSVVHFAIEQLSEMQLRAWLKQNSSPTIFLWALAIIYAGSSLTTVKHLAKLRSRSRDRSFRQSCDPHFLHSVQIIEECYDVTRPLRHRIDRLEQMISSAVKLPVIEMELTILAAATRWLRKIQQNELAATTFSRLEMMTGQVAPYFRSRLQIKNEEIQ